MQRLFWGTASSTVEQFFYAKMDEMKMYNLEAYKYLIQRNSNKWYRAFFNLDFKCAAFENDISESYHRVIIVQRSKPIITMLEDGVFDAKISGYEQVSGQNNKINIVRRKY